MKKIALCISGYLRTFNECYPSIKENVIQDYDCDIFIHTYDKYRDKPSYHNLDEYDREKNYDLDMDFLENISNLKVLYIEKWNDIKHTFYNLSKTLNVNYAPSVFASPYKIYKCNELKKNYEKENNFIYDLVIRTRGDQIFTKRINFENLKENQILINSCPFGDEDRVHNCNSNPDVAKVVLNDRFAAGSSENIDYLSNLYNNIGVFTNNENYLPSPIERLFYLYLEQNNKIILEKRNLKFYVKHSPITNTCRLCGENF